MRRRGFTLIELMIVIAIIAIIAAIAIPNLLDARKAANEASAIASLRALHSAQNIYREQDKDGNGTLDYANSLGALTNASLIDAVLGQGVKQGYTFEVVDGGQTLFTWSGNADAEEAGDSGDRMFYIDHTGVIRYTIDSTSTFSSTLPAIGK